MRNFAFFRFLTPRGVGSMAWVRHGVGSFSLAGFGNRMRSTKILANFDFLVLYHFLLGLEMIIYLHPGICFGTELPKFILLAYFSVYVIFNFIL